MKDDYIYLTSCSEFEFELFCNTLREAKIPIDIEISPINPYDVSGAYKKIFVPKSKYDEAKKILKI